MSGSVGKEGKTWFYNFEAGKNENGKRIRKKKRGFKTKKEAEKALAEIETAFHSGLFIEKDQIKFGDLLGYWLVNYAKPNTSPKTYEGYQYIISKHIKPFLGMINLNKLTPMHLQSYYMDKINKCNLSAQSVKHHHRLISKILSDAVKWQQVARNVADAVSPPKPKKVEMKTLNAQEVMILLNAAELFPNYYTVIATAVYTGMRRGEVLGLRWQDVDLDRKVISVRQTLQSVSGHGLIIKEPKSGKARTVSMTKKLVEILKKHKVAQNKQKMIMGSIYHENDLVFTNEIGKPIQPSELTRKFSMLIQKADIPNIRFHDLRHTHATLMLQQGVHPKIVSERLGHSTVGITLDTYSHVLPNMQQNAAEQFESLLIANVK